MGTGGASSHLALPLILDNGALSSRELVASLLPSIFFPSMYSTEIYWAPAKGSVRLQEHHDREHMVPHLKEVAV